MDQDKEQAIALMRYSAIAPLISGTQTDYDSLNSFFREVSAKGLKSPNGELRHYACQASNYSSHLRHLYRRFNSPFTTYCLSVCAV